MNSERMHELYADRALWGLDETEEQELATAIAESNARFDLSWERAVAISSYELLEVEDAPTSLVERLEADANAFLASRPTDGPQLRAVPPPTDEVDADAPGSPLPWLVAAAAVFVAVWIGMAGTSSDVDPTIERQALLTADSTVRWEWQDGPSDRRGEPSGDVVWNTGEQRGYMRFRGLPANDPAKFQYQLWIFDGKRTDPQPVDLGR